MFKNFDNGLRNAVFGALSHRSVAATIAKVSAIARNDEISSVMVTRLVVTAPDYEENIRNGLRTGIYCPEPVDFKDLRRAFSAFGQALTWEVAMSAGLETLVKPLLAASEDDIVEFMRHALATAAGCGVVADFLSQPRGPYVAAGLFHNFGLPVLMHDQPEKYAQAKIELSGSGQKLEEWEQSEFGFTHEDAGALFLAAATMPDYIWSSAASHHSDESTGDRLVASVRLCANVAHQVGCTSGFANACGPIHPGLVAELGLDELAMAQMAERMGNAAVTAGKLVDKVA